MNQVTRDTDDTLRSVTVCRLVAWVTVGFLQDCRRMFGSPWPELTWSGRGPKTAQQQLDDSQATQAHRTATFGDSRRQVLEPERGSEGVLYRDRNGWLFSRQSLERCNWIEAYGDGWLRTRWQNPCSLIDGNWGKGSETTTENDN